MTNPNTQNSTPVTDALRSIGTAFNTLKETVAERRRIIGLSLSTTALLATGCSGTEATKPVSPDKSVTVPAAAEQTAVPLEPSLSGGHTNKAPDKKDTGLSDTDTDAKAEVTAAKEANAEIFRFAGASKKAAENVTNQEVNVFLGADRGEIVGERKDGACIVATQEGKLVEEFTKTELKAGMSPEEAKSAYTAGFCDAEGGVNAPAVASHMAMLEAMKNNIDIKGEYSRIQTEMTKKYLDAMKGNPDLAQAYYETVMEFLNSSEFGEAQDISGQNDTSIYTNAEGKIVIVNVQNKDGAAATLMQLSTINNDGVVVTQKIDGKTCTQVRLFKTPSVDAPAPETPQAAPAPEVPKADTPAPTPDQPAPETPKADTPTPTPNQPAPPKADTPTPTPNQPAPPEEFTYTTSVCVGLLGNGQEQHEEFTGVGNTENEAKADANRQAKDAKGDCTPEETTTSTSTTTTAPTTTTGTSTTLPPIEVTTTTGVTVSTAPPTTPSTAPPTTPSTAPPTTPSTPPPPTTSPPPPPTTSPPPPPTTSPPPPPTTRPPVTEPPKTCESNPELCPTITVTPTIPEGPSGTAQPPATVLGFARSKFDSARTKADAKLGKLVTDAVQAGLGRLGNAAERANRANRANR